MSFGTPLTVTGPHRAPAQMLADQEYGGHASIHDGDTAEGLGLAGAPIEGPTHFSQVDPLAVQLQRTCSCLGPRHDGRRTRSTVAGCGNSCHVI